MLNKKNMNANSSAKQTHPFIKGPKMTGIMAKPRILLEGLRDHLKQHQFEFSNN